MPPALRQEVQTRSFPRVLANLPATDLVVVREADMSVRVVDRQGEGRITRQRRDEGNVYRYQLLDGHDPLGYTDSPPAAALMDGQFHPSRAWLAASLGTQRPDAAAQLGEFFDSPRSGDAALFAKDGWSYASTTEGGHGGLLRHEILVPFFLAGPGLPAGATIPAARTVDLCPTLLDLLGRRDSFFTLGPPDGVDIADELRSAATSQPASR